MCWGRVLVPSTDFSSWALRGAQTYVSWVLSGFPEPWDTSDRASLHRDVPVLLAWWRLISGQGWGGVEGPGIFLNAGSAVRDGPSTSLLLSVFTSFFVSSSLSSENSHNGERV